MNNNIKFKQFHQPTQAAKFTTLLQSDGAAEFLSVFTRSRSGVIHKMIRQLSSKMKKWIRTEGIVNLCKRIKDSEKSYLLTKTTKWFSLRYFKKKGVSEMGIRTLFTIHRNMKTKPSPDFDSISHIGTTMETFLGINNNCKDFEKVCNSAQFQIPHRATLPELMVKINLTTHPLWCGAVAYTAECPPVDCNNRTGGLEAPLRINTKGGPNGPSLGTQSQDLCALKCTQSNLLGPIARLWHTWGYKFDENQYSKLHQEVECPHLASKLLALQDKSCKTRVVATLDSYSQVALRPVHRMLSLLLRRIRNDFTEDHAGGVRKLMTLQGELWSIDLSNATDTLPVGLGIEFLRRNTPKSEFPDVDQFCNDVMSVLTDRDFDYNGQKIRYNTGQPMGAYSSFPILAVTNHLLINMARVQSGLPVGAGYAIVGDDIVISGRNVAERYIALLESLKVPINHQKVVTGYRTFEFCRRIVKDGVIRSVPSWNALYWAAVGKDPTPIISLYRDYNKEVPSYNDLSELFEKRDLRNMLALNSRINLIGQPNICRIPDDVVAHADRTLSVLDSFRSEQWSFETSDPYLSRLSYAKTIASLFKNKIKKMGAWMACRVVRANTFYLNYVRTYTQRKKFLSRLFKISENSHANKLRNLCMIKRSQWTSDGLRPLPQQ